jgi:hypothetical protein
MKIASHETFMATFHIIGYLQVVQYKETTACFLESFILSVMETNNRISYGIQQLQLPSLL